LAIKKSLEKLDLFIENGIAKVKEIIAEKLTAEIVVTKEIKTERITTNEIQIVDKVTGEIYCTWIENGEWVKVKGECGTISNETASNGTANNQATSSEQPTCTPNWQCKEWQPSTDSVCSGETFTQNCVQWIDLNNCGISETPTTTQQATGTKDCSTSSTKSTTTISQQ